ncbi:hypothetical protein ACFQE7_12745 [Nonomuraea ferruginea]|uniref:hypothetical protein n=1 Tax=Nonomuraea ferruginea TaxID=46174 RepID=UPI003622187E
MAGVVARAGPFHLDHLGPEVGEQHGGVRPGQDPAEVGDEQPVQRGHAGAPR